MSGTHTFEPVGGDFPDTCRLCACFRDSSNHSPSKITLQEFADRVVDPQYRRTLVTAQEACAALGREFADKPVCCGEQVDIRGWFGDAYLGHCLKCGKFIADVTGPQFSESGSSVSFLSDDKVDTDTPNRWIYGTNKSQ